jgi:hypothetical protein
MPALRSGLALALLAVAALIPACAPLVGDSCEDSSDCGRTMYCERSLPDGYCTLQNCDTRNCPEEGVCIRFNEDLSWCMQPCDGNGDCRDGYRCITDFGVHPFCGDARGTTPTPIPDADPE